MNTIVHGDSCLKLKDIKDETIQLIWTDPPFNTGDQQKIASTNKSYLDIHNDYSKLMTDVFTECFRVLKQTGAMCICLDYREVHDCKVIIDSIFGKSNFRGEIIYHFELGNISKKWWTNKHNTILTYSKSENALFKFDKVPVTLRKSPKGTYIDPKKITSVWSYTMSNSDSQRVGYPNQKPVEIIQPFIEVHTDENDIVLDPFAGSGSVGEACKNTGRYYHLIDINPVSIETINLRLNKPSII